MKILETVGIVCLTLSCVGPAGCGAAVAGSPVTRPDDPPVQYTVRLENPQTQMVEMTMALRGVKTPTVDVMLPVWRPGRYAVLDPAGSVRGFSTRSGDGGALEWEKIDKSTWRITRPENGDDEVVVDYRVYANSLGDRTRHVDDTHAFLSPASVFMYTPGLRGVPLNVTVAAPEGWEIATGLEHAEGDGRALQAPNYDVLVDSPLEIGVQSRIDFEVEGVPHEIVVWWGGSPEGKGEVDRGEFFDPEKLKADFAKIVAAQKAVFGEFPYTRYVFLIHCYAGGGGGTEHLNSTIMQCSPEVFQVKARYTRFLALTSHEFFHTWNVKQLRPAGLKPYDYQKENYTDLLWVAEGTTSYYEDLILVRTGHIKPDDFLGTLASWIDSSKKRPGGTVQSLMESSFDAWIKFNRPSPDNVNSTVSFYDKGAHVSLLLDLVIREASGNEASLDSVMRDLYERFPLDGPGFTGKDVQESAEKFAGRDLSEFFAKYVRGTDPLDFETALQAAGLDLIAKPVKDDDAAKDKDKGDDGDKSDTDKDDEKDGEGNGSARKRAYLGITVENRSDLAAVTTVLADGPAYRAGILVGDLVLAVDGRRVRTADWDRTIKALEPEEPVRLTLFRMDVLREIEVVVEGRPDVKWTVKRIKEPSDQQKAVYESWLGQKWPGRS